MRCTSIPSLTVSTPLPSHPLSPPSFPSPAGAPEVHDVCLQRPSPPSWRGLQLQDTPRDECHAVQLLAHIRLSQLPAATEGQGKVIAGSHVRAAGWVVHCCIHLPVCCRLHVSLCSVHVAPLAAQWFRHTCACCRLSTLLYPTVGFLPLWNSDWRKHELSVHSMDFIERRSLRVYIPSQ